MTNVLIRDREEGNAKTEAEIGVTQPSQGAPGATKAGRAKRLILA
jgi:hypothetical protein